MKNVELVIKIPEEIYKASQIIDVKYEDVIQIPLEVIKNGKPLSKGHGDLKDFEKIYTDMTEKEELARQRVIDTPTNSPCYMRYIAQLNERTAFKEMLYDAPTIIEADKENET